MLDLKEADRRFAAWSKANPPEGPLDIPAFLRIPPSVRAAAWARNPPVKIEFVPPPVAGDVDREKAEALQREMKRQRALNRIAKLKARKALQAKGPLVVYRGRLRPAAFVEALHEARLEAARAEWAKHFGKPGAVVFAAPPPQTPAKADNVELLDDREAARAAGHRFFFGVCDVAGHVGKRYVSTGTCTECERETKRKRAGKKPATDAPLLDNRAAARRAGHRFFFEACPIDGHAGKRYVSTGTCADCERARRLERQKKEK